MRHRRREKKRKEKKQQRQKKKKQQLPKQQTVHLHPPPGTIIALDRYLSGRQDKCSAMYTHAHTFKECKYRVDVTTFFFSSPLPLSLSTVPTSLQF